MKLLLVTPPLTQLNTPYPATAYLTGFLRSRGLNVEQADPALEWVLRLFSPHGIQRVLQALSSLKKPHHSAVAHALQHQDAIVQTLPVALALLQNRDISMAHRIAARRLLPEGPRFQSIGPTGQEESYLDWAFGSMGIVDRARYFASLFVEDLSDAITHGIDPHFGFARYGESLAASVATLDPLLEELATPRLTADVLHELTLDLLLRHTPDVVGMTLPFPGNVLGALRMAHTIRAQAPNIKIVWGGGYVNTELRDVSDPRLFNFVDFITYDDGEKPLLNVLEHLNNTRSKSQLLRTRIRDEDNTVQWLTHPAEHDIPIKDCGTPTYDGLPLGDYLSLLDMLNPMHRLWSDTRWNKLTVAHGCYWKKCSFCDISLDYIANYSPVTASLLVDRIEALVAETGTRGFHFVDEAAPPAGLRALAEELLRRNVQIAWWGNVRFEKTFTQELCNLLARSGCIAMSGGLEVAGNRLLKLMQKGVTVEQVARVTRAMGNANIRVHAYLMYGFPTQTEQETVDSLEYVRQLFVNGCLDSAFWHRFSATAHAPIGLNPEAYNIRLLPQPQASFARNDLPFEDLSGCDHTRLGPGLQKAVYNYMHGLCLEDDVRRFFEHKVPKPKVAREFVEQALRAQP